MGYLYIAAATCGIAGHFILKKVYQRRFGETSGAVVLFPLVLSVFNFLFYLAVNHFAIRFGGFTVLMALLYAIADTYNAIVGLIIFKYCAMSVFSMFIMLGGMLIPFLYGVLLSPAKESFTPGKAVGLVLLVLALVLVSLGKGKGKVSVSAKGLLLCLSVFVVNGCLGTVSKIHQVYGELELESTLGTADFLLWVTVFSTLFAAVIYAVWFILDRRKKRLALSSVPDGAEKPASGEKRELFPKLLLIAIIVVISCAGTLCNLTAQKTVPASVTFPMTSGGTIVLTTLFGSLLFGEKQTARTIVGVALACLSIVLFAF